jgi:hypothetical protein
MPADAQGTARLRLQQRPPGTAASRWRLYVADGARDRGRDPFPPGRTVAEEIRKGSLTESAEGTEPTTQPRRHSCVPAVNRHRRRWRQKSIRWIVYWWMAPYGIALAETKEVLYLVNRSGNRPSHEHSSLLFDLAINQCKKAGFRKIVLLGDTDFSSTEHLDRWDNQGVKFILGFDARWNLCRIAENLPETAWKRLDRPKQSCAPEKERTKRPYTKEPIVVANGYENQKFRAENYAEFDYRPTACGKFYRMVVVRKEIDVTSGQMFLFDKDKHFFHITNEDQGKVTGREVIRGANRRCNQENTISQLKACGALSVPLNDLESNGPYRLFASLAWTLKLWSGMMIRFKGNANQKRVQRDAQSNYPDGVLDISELTETAPGAD